MFSVTDAKHFPADLVDKLVVTPSSLKLGVIPEKGTLDSYIETVRNNLTVDFDQWMPGEESDPVIKTVPLEEMDGIYFADQSVKNLSVSLDVEGYGHSTVTIPLLDTNVTILCDEGYEAVLTQRTLADVVLCGPKDALKNFDAENFTIVIEAKGQAEGAHTVTVRPQVKEQEGSADVMWVYYGAGEYKVEYSIRKSD